MTKIKEARMALGISASEAARRIGISRQRYSQYENGKYEANYEMLLRIGEAFGVSVDYLIDRKNTPAEIRRSALIGRVMELTDAQIAALADALDRVTLVQPIAETDTEADDDSGDRARAAVKSRKRRLRTPDPDAEEPVPVAAGDPEHRTAPESE